MTRTGSLSEVTAEERLDGSLWLLDGEGGGRGWGAGGNRVEAGRPVREAGSSHAGGSGGEQGKIQGHTLLSQLTHRLGTGFAILLRRPSKACPSHPHLTARWPWLESCLSLLPQVGLGQVSSCPWVSVPLSKVRRIIPTSAALWIALWKGKVPSLRTQIRTVYQHRCMPGVHPGASPSSESFGST